MVDLKDNKPPSKHQGQFHFPITVDGCAIPLTNCCVPKLVEQSNVHRETNVIVLRVEFDAKTEKISSGHSSFQCSRNKLTPL